MKFFQKYDLWIPKIHDTTSEYTENKSSGLYHAGWGKDSVAGYLYKIRDDSNVREFLGTDTEDCQGHSLHEEITLFVLLLILICLEKHLIK